MKKQRGRPRIYCVRCKKKKPIYAKDQCNSCYCAERKKTRAAEFMTDYMTMLGSLHKSEELLRQRKKDLEGINERFQKVVDLTTRQIKELEEVLEDECVLDPSHLSSPTAH